MNARDYAIDSPIENGISYGMNTTISIDKAGRLVLPKAIRERMHLTENSKLRVKLVGDKIELTPEAARVEIDERDGLPVITGWDGYDAAEAVTESRDEHLDRLAEKN